MTFLGVPPVTEEAIDLRLADMDRLGSRPYAEIGVPMFLVAEDLTATAEPAPQDGPGRLLALLLAESAEALRRRRPELTPGDVARLVEALADRHFLTLAAPSFSQTAELHPEVR